MATYIETLDRMMRFYPSLFPVETDALHHLFFILGNGYNWEGGELVSYGYDENTQSARKRDLGNFEYHQGLLRPNEHPVFLDYYQEKFHLINNMTDEQYVEHERQEQLKKRGTAVRIKLYPLCGLSKISNIPDDIKPDWKDAAVKAVEWAYGSEVVKTTNDFEWLKKASIRLARYGTCPRHGKRYMEGEPAYLYCGCCAIADND